MFRKDQDSARLQACVSCTETKRVLERVLVWGKKKCDFADSFFKKYYRRIVDLQHCVSFRCTAEWFMDTYMYIEYWVAFPALYGRFLSVIFFIHSSVLQQLQMQSPALNVRLGGSPGLGNSFQGHLCRRWWLKWKGQSFLKESENRAGWKNEQPFGMESHGPQRKECTSRRRQC